MNRTGGSSQSRPFFICGYTKQTLNRLFLSALFSTALLTACASGRETAACTPGTAVACACSNGAPGTMTCTSAQVFGACNCDSADLDLGLPSDMDVASDATPGEPLDGGDDLGAIDLGVTDLGALDLGVTDLGTPDAGMTYDCRTLDCDDGNPCTTDTCSSSTGCSHRALSSLTPCDDGRWCTVSDHCNLGICTGNAMDCGTGCVCSESMDACIADVTTGSRPAPTLCLIPAEP